MTPLVHVFPEITAIDRALRSIGRPLYTLDPSRSEARLPSEVMVAVGLHGSGPLTSAFAVGLAKVVRAMLTAFPDNLFWDLDYMVAEVADRARRSADPVASARADMDQIAALQDLFGVHTPVRFRYVHDFAYGFDWAKWVSKEPRVRSGISPFDPVFLSYMHRRGGELLALIRAGDDPKYPPLPDGSPRNPFGFSREPIAELDVHRDLARRRLVPIEAWRPESHPTWQLPYAAVRHAAAQTLGHA